MKDIQAIQISETYFYKLKNEELDIKNVDYFVKITLSRGKNILLDLDFQGHPIDQADVCLHCHHGQMAILGVKGKPLEVHGTSDLWSD